MDPDGNGEIKEENTVQTPLGHTNVETGSICDPEVSGKCDCNGTCLKMLRAEPEGVVPLNEV